MEKILLEPGTTIQIQSNEMKKYWGKDFVTGKIVGVDDTANYYKCVITDPEQLDHRGNLLVLSIHSDWIKKI